MRLAIFDLDNTLLGGDSDHAWGAFLCEKGIVDPQDYQDANDYFYKQYQNGSLDIVEFLSFALKPLAQHSIADLQAWHQEFMQTKIEPMVLPKALSLLKHHRDQGDYLLIITATNGFITRPIAERFEVDDILATEPEILNNQYTGSFIGSPCFQDGKVTRLHEWLDKTGYSLSGSYFYSDSCNDLPLLEKVDNPIAVNPDEILTKVANERAWPILDLR
ncbi:HAD-IB family hydrolase [Nitrincola tibetensis]|uniref:HAD-IB family hydrolase n=1 Tax=Nitrincola tibetensis TaxID=2219697 RepID=A0A364NI97_9GAMM|nr:HAD family hydrolase [Nitrincola tibetensis]RAU16849.1 HAD-IB family hydrolase [Nitrincola tibetensis]